MADDDYDRRHIRRREEDAAILDRLDRLETDVDRHFDRLETAIATAGRTFTLEQIEKLDGRYLSRTGAAVEYVPRIEHEHRRDWTIRILLAVVALASIVEPLVLRVGA